MSITDNVGKILSELKPGVMLVAAAKTQPLEGVLEAIEAGVKIIGENYVQEAEAKFGKYGEKIRGKAELHLIGPLQKGKVKRALKLFDVIQSVDSIGIAEEISKRAEKEIKIFLEVNIAGEDTKRGFNEKEIITAAGKIAALPKIRVAGLMAMPQCASKEMLRSCFRKMRKIFDEIKKQCPSLEFLSMGMSSDYKIAVEEGSNMVRIGTLIFGERKKN